MEKEIKNAKIDSTMLGYESHGILTYYIYISYGGSACQAFGGYSLGGEYTTQVIQTILRTVGVEKWEDLKDKHIRVECDNSKIYRIGNILEYKWFDPSNI